MVDITEIALRKLSGAFDEFIGQCMDEDGKPVAPDIRALAAARGYLPPYCKLAYKKRGRSKRRG